jgi:hypothetical protein
MKKSTHLPGLACIFVLTLASCIESAPAGPAFALLPREALAAVVVESPYKLLAGAEAFWKAAGLDASEGTSLEAMLRKSMPTGADVEKLFDFARPWALALVPFVTGRGEGSSVAQASPFGFRGLRALLYVPYKGQKTEDLAAFFEGKLLLVASARGYAVLSAAEGSVEFPPSKPLDPSRLSRYPTGAVKLWADPKALRLVLMDDWKPIEKAARRFVSERAPADSAFAALEEAGLALLDDIKSADAAILPGEEGLRLRIGVDVQPGGPTAKYLARAAMAPSALEWARLIDGRSLFGYLWSVDPSLAAELSNAVALPLYRALGLPGESLDAYAAFVKKASNLSGPRGAAVFDMAVDPAAFKPAEGEKLDVAAAVKKGFQARFEYQAEAKDEAGLRDFYRGLEKNPDLAAFMGTYADSLGMELKIRNRDLKDGSFSYGELGFSFGVKDPQKLGYPGGEGRGEAEAALAAIGELFRLRWTAAGGRMIATSGDAAALKLLAGKSASPGASPGAAPGAAQAGLGADPLFSAFARSLPGKPILLSYVSMRRVAELALSLASLSPNSITFPDATRLGSWLSCLSVEPGKPAAEMGFLAPAPDIGALWGLFKKASGPRQE